MIEDRYIVNLLNSTGNLTGNIAIIPNVILPEGVTPASGSGFVIQLSSEVYVTDNLILGGGGNFPSSGIRLQSSSNINIENNTISERGDWEFTFQGVLYSEYVGNEYSYLRYAIDVFESSAKIVNNNITTVDNGITIKKNSQPTCVNNTITDITYFGIYVDDFSDPVIHENIITNASVGIQILNATALITNNTISNCRNESTNLSWVIPPYVNHISDYVSPQFDYRLTSATGTSHRPITQASDGIVYNAWIDDRNGYNQIFMAKSNHFGVVFEDAQELTDSTYDPVFIDFKIEGNNLAIVWQNEVIEYPPLPQLYVIYSSDGGNSWTDPFDISAEVGAAGSFWPSIDIEDGEIYLLFHAEHWDGSAYVGSSKLIWTEDDLATLNMENFYILTNGDTELGYTSNIAVENGNIHVILLDDWNQDIEYWRSQDGGSTWDFGPGPMKIGDYTPNTIQGGEFLGYFDLDVKGDILQLVFSEYRSGSHDVSVYTSLNNGDAWAYQQLTASTGDSLYPVVSIEPNGYSSIVYGDDRDGSRKVYYQRLDDTGTPIGSEICLTPAVVKGAWYPSINVNQNNRVFISWEDWRFGIGEIFTKQMPIFITNNTIASNYNGIVTDYYSNATINYNNISGNTDYGILNNDAGVLINAQYNWWGAVDGPEDEAGIINGNGDFISYRVDGTNWLNTPYP